MRNLEDICHSYLLLLKKEGKIKLTKEQIIELSKSPKDQQKIKYSIDKELQGFENYKGSKISSKRAWMIWCTVIIKQDVVTKKEVYNDFVKQVFDLIEKHRLVNLEALRGGGKSYIFVLYVSFKTYIIEYFQTLISFHIPDMRENWFETFKLMIDENEMLLSKKEVNQKNIIWGIKKCIYNKGLIRGITLGSTPRSAHPNLVITDDILGKEGQTKYPLSYIQDHILGELYPIVRRKKARFIIAGTPVSDMDIHHELAKDFDNKYHRKLLLCTRPIVFISKAGWACRIFPGILDFEKKTVLLPDLFSYEELMQDKKTMGDFKFYREIQCEVKIDKSALISKYLFEGCYDDKLSLQETGEEGKKYIHIVDPSAGEGENPDYAAQGIFEIKGKKKILRYIWHEKMLPIIDPDGGTNDLTNEVMRKNKDFLRCELIIENNSIGRILIQNLRKYGFDPTEHNTKDDKVAIMMDSISELKRKEGEDSPDVVIPNNPECSFTQEAVYELKNECLKYGVSRKAEGKVTIGGKGSNDDLVFCFLTGIHYCKEESSEMIGAVCQD